MKILSLAFAIGLLISLAASSRADESTPGDSTSFRVLSFNIRYHNKGDGKNAWPYRKDEVAKFIDARADIVGLQEVLDDQREDLVDRLKAFDHYAVGRDDGKKRGESTAIFYRRDRFERLDEGTFWLSESPDKVGSKSWDSSLPRVCSWLKLKDKTDGREFHFFNTHFDHRGATARTESGKLIRSQIDAIADEGPIVLTGDFNCQRTQPPIEAILAGEKPRISWAADLSQTARTGPKGTFQGFGSTPESSRAEIDFIFVRGWYVKNYGVVPAKDGDKYLSDHEAIAAEVTQQSP